jgi:RimJ/RimL family protein N-acetyltransferase
MGELSTERLLLRHWRPSDLEPFAQLNADPEVMRHFPSTLTRSQSDQFAATVIELMDRRGWGLWAVEARGTAPFIGFVGLNIPRFDAHFMPAIEIGWRLGRSHWGHGYATEAANAALDFAFDALGYDEVVSFTATVNQRSLRVMERLGMTHEPSDDFDHPNVAEGPLRRHLLYRIRPQQRQ